MASLHDASQPTVDQNDVNVASLSKDAEIESDVSKTGTSKRPVGMPDAKKCAEIDMLWQNLKRRSEQQLNEKKPSTRRVNWNVSYDTPRRPKQISTMQSLPDETKNVVSKSDDAILGDLHAKIVAPSKPTSHTKPSTTDQETEEKKTQKRSRGGVDALLATLQKKKKPTVLDTSKQDWRAYKASHATDAEELDAHQKSTEQYLEKQEFLTKAAHTEHQDEIRRKHKPRST